MIGRGPTGYESPNSLQELNMRRRCVAVTVVTVLLSACGGDDPIEADESIAAFVGDWNTTSVVLTSTFNTDLSVDLIELGSSFDLNVQPSVHYTAILVFAGQEQPEFSRLSLSGSSTANSRLPHEIFRRTPSRGAIASSWMATRSSTSM